MSFYASFKCMLMCLLHFLEHSSVQSVSVVKRRSLSSYRSEKLDLQAIVSDVQFLEVRPYLLHVCFSSPRLSQIDGGEGGRYFYHYVHVTPKSRNTTDQHYCIRL